MNTLDVLVRDAPKDAAAPRGAGKAGASARHDEAQGPVERFRDLLGKLAGKTVEDGTGQPRTELPESTADEARPAGARNLAASLAALAGEAAVADGATPEIEPDADKQQGADASTTTPSLSADPKGHAANPLSVALSRLHLESQVQKDEHPRLQASPSVPIRVGGDASALSEMTSSGKATPVPGMPTSVDDITFLSAMPQTGVDPTPAEATGIELRPKVSVVQQETHFEPVLRLSPTQQIVDAVKTEIAAARPAPATDIDGASQTREAGGPLKVLSIRLEPQSLGAVTVTMRLTGGSLNVHIVASSHETVQMLQQDRDQLSQLLRTSGYSADVASIQQEGATGLQLSSGNQQQSTGGQGQPSTHQSFAQGQHDTAGQRFGASNGENAPQQNRHQEQAFETAGDDAQPGNDRSVDGLYL